jgi:hypothetical protein
MEQTEILKALAEGTAKGVSDSALKDFHALTGKFCSEVGEALGYYGALVRLWASLKVMRRAEEMLRKANIEPSPVCRKLFLPIMESASLEDDEELQERWAALLANAADPNVESVPPCFIDILRQLSVYDARFISAICRHPLTWATPIERAHTERRDIIQHYCFEDYLLFSTWCGLGFSESGNRSLAIAEQKTELGAQRRKDELKYGVSLDNLIRLGLLHTQDKIRIPAPTAAEIERGHDYAGQVVNHETTCTFSVTTLGYHFVELCTKSEPRKSD